MVRRFDANQRQPACHILVVDDDKDIRRLSADILRSSGYLVDAVEDGEVAWSALQAGNYDLLITDNNMPKISGFELLRKLRSDSMTLPVIMVSGTLPPEELSRHPLLRLSRTLLKPFTSDELLKTVKKLLTAPESGTPQLPHPITLQT